MKIFTSISYYKPHVSGLTICAQRLIDGLSKKDLEFTVLTSQYQKNLPKYKEDKKVKIIRSPVWMTIGKVPVMPRYLFQAWREAAKNDLVWIHLPQAEGLVTLIIAKILNKPVVSTVHCLPLLPSGINRILFQGLFDWLNNLVIRLSDRVVYYTKDYAENTKELLHIPAKSSYILPPVPEWKGRRKKEKGRGKKTSLLVGFAGRVSEDKGLEYLLEALSLMKAERKNVELIIAGNMSAVGESGYKRKINNLLKILRAKVKFVGEIDPENMIEFYRQIDLLVLPSVNRTEAFGMVQVEAILAGIPVIASDLPGVRVPIKLTGNGELVAVGNPKTLMQTIIKVMQNRLSPRSISEKTVEVFSQDKTFNDYSNIFYRAANIDT